MTHFFLLDLTGICLVKFVLLLYQHRMWLSFLLYKATYNKENERINVVLGYFCAHGGKTSHGF